ncbi:Tripartite DNA replication factor [Coelomomyces lativittatus]|nr:Tripartite DNA replication factor [Coelomomyces lativittatus]KAJ1514662.1 Tripartite DNA replication factor [Coelomomyces lativittatus]KAJ1517941.1 Tripartite DNA replication factor [Coelomomyces lativittatus]
MRPPTPPTPPSTHPSFASNHRNSTQHINVTSDDDFWDQFETELVQVATLADHHHPSPSTPSLLPLSSPTPKLKVTRYTVLLAEPCSSTIFSKPLILHVLHETKRLKLTLKSPWNNLTYTSGDILHIIETNSFHPSSSSSSPSSSSIFPTFPTSDSFLPTEANEFQNFVILHPDILVPGASVSDSHECLRRSILNSWSRIKDLQLPQLLGTLSHDFLQRLLLRNTPNLPDLPTTEELQRCISQLIHEYRLELHLMGHSLDEAEKQLYLVYQHYVSTFYPTLIYNQTQANAPFARNSSTPFVVDQVVDIEENIWAPAFGLKGKLDVTLKVRTSPTTLTSTYVPMEIKTGKRRSISHHAQTIFYTLLLAEKYPLNERIDWGVLFHVATHELLTVSAKFTEVRDLLMLRNHYALALTSFFHLPPMLRSPSTCERCYVNTTCFMYHKTMEKGTAETALVHPTLFFEKTGHLTNTHLAFLETWVSLINLEASFTSSTAIKPSPPWLDGNASGSSPFASSCTGLKLSTPRASSSSSSFGPFYATFSFSRDTTQKESDVPFFPFNVGDFVSISQESGPYGLATGFVDTVEDTAVTIRLDRPFRCPSKDDDVGPRTFRLDPATSTDTVVASMRFHLFSLFMPITHPLRDLVVDLKPPRFHRSIASSSFSSVSSSLKNTPLDGQATSSSAVLNASQWAIVEKVMCMQDYCLVAGLPGTGKSTVLSHLLVWLVRLGKSVLLTSHTHSAVDTVLLKLHVLDPSLPFLRLGSLHRVHPSLHPFTLPSLEIHQLSQVNLFASTALGIQHPVLLRQQFDYCIVDEATQILLPLVLGPLQLARQFVLVGDPYQLPPVVNHPEAKPLEESLFERLLKAHPEAMCTLDIQYRMESPLMNLANTLVYHQSLSLGSSTGSTTPWTVVVTPSFSTTPPPWTSMLVVSPLLFFDTPFPETPCSRGLTNEGQIHFLQSWLPWFPPDSVAILTPYRAQVTQLRKTFPSLEVCTMDQYQGRDKPVIVLSLVRCNPKGHVGQLLRDWKRINVALTRARVKLILIGCANTLSHSLLWKALLDYFRDHDYFISVHQEENNNTNN